MRYIVCENEEGEWMVWDRDRMMHCGFYISYSEAKRIAATLNEKI